MTIRIARAFKRRDFRKLSHNEHGGVALEMALIAPFLIAMLMGAFEFGRAFTEAQRYASAARAGAQLALWQFAQANTVVINDVVAAAREDAEDDDASLDVNAELNCWCPANPDVSVACDTVCDGGSLARAYITVTVAGEIDLIAARPLILYPGVSDPLSLSETAEIRLR